VNRILIAALAGCFEVATVSAVEESTPLAPLIAAVEARDLAGVRKALSDGASPETRGPDGKSALIRAAELGETEVAFALLKAGADPSLKSPAGNSLLHFVAAGGSIPLAKHVLALKAPVDTISPQHADTALGLAVLSNRTEMVQLLLQHGANPNLGVSRDSLGRFAPPLSVAAQHGNPEIIDLLLGAGADPAKANNMGDLPIHYAARSGKLENLRRLLERGADVGSRNHDGWDAMGMAAANGHVEILRLLVARGGDPERGLREAVRKG